jgi:hypothetical protein
MGCITLELIIWLLYGYKELRDFNESIKSQSNQGPSPYWEIESRDGIRVAKVHSTVIECMEQILSGDPECIENTAIRDLVVIIMTKLLIVPLPPPRWPTLRPSKTGEDDGVENVSVTEPDTILPTIRQPGPHRATAKKLCEKLDDIIGKGASDERYWSTGKNRDGVRGPRPMPKIITQDKLLPPDPAIRPRPLADRKKEPSPLGLSPQSVAQKLAPVQMSNVSKENVINSLSTQLLYQKLLTES